MTEKIDPVTIPDHTTVAGNWPLTGVARDTRGGTRVLCYVDPDRAAALLEALAKHLDYTLTPPPVADPHRLGAVVLATNDADDNEDAVQWVCTAVYTNRPGSRWTTSGGDWSYWDTLGVVEVLHPGYTPTEEADRG